MRISCAFGNVLGALQAYPVLGISRTETADLMEA